MKTHLIDLPGLPQSTLPFSSGVVAEGRFLFVAGQGPYDPQIGTFVRGSIGEQTRLTLLCIERIVKAAGASLEDVVSCRIFLQQLTETTFSELNSAYKEYFKGRLPARTTIGCQLLNIDVEIDCIVRLPNSPPDEH